MWYTDWNDECKWEKGKLVGNGEVRNGFEITIEFYCEVNTVINADNYQ